MADNDSYEKDMEEIFGETRGERERKRLKQISDAAAESVRLANDFKQELKKEEIQSDDPIIQKCLDIVRSKKVTVKDLSGLGFYALYIGDEMYFQIHKDSSGPTYSLTVGLQKYHFYGQQPDLEELLRLCVDKYNEQLPERINDTLNLLNNADKDKNDKKTSKNNRPERLLLLAGPLTFGCVLFFVLIGNSIEDKKTQRVNKQVESYEKTLPPDYLEYKQAVEHYRDSLMHVKGR